MVLTVYFSKLQHNYLQSRFQITRRSEGCLLTNYQLWFHLAQQKQNFVDSNLTTRSPLSLIVALVVYIVQCSIKIIQLREPKLDPCYVLNPPHRAHSLSPRCSKYSLRCPFIISLNFVANRISSTTEYLSLTHC